ncbi:mfs transporter [Trichoderma cornu-damae]|uniref:Mfs transporter n=1 Tax=Trichoderma cornu-damae TaxID=654480 RepID=A0A9P8QIK2_9HYPO|nr:mfs transporter [Trichoderma cornu-damae]
MSTPAKPQNGIRPSCASCIMRGELCFYERGNRRNLRRYRMHVNAPRDSAPQAWGSWPVDEVDALLGLGCDDAASSLLVAGPQPGDPCEWLMPSSGELPGVGIGHPCPGDQSLALPQIPASPTAVVPQPEPPEMSELSELPELPELLQLVDLFFEKLYRYLPVIHRQTITSAMDSRGVEGVPPVLLFAIVAVSAGSHPDPRIRQRQPCWYEEAKSRVSKEMQLPHHVLQTLQAAVLVVYLGLVLVDYSPPIMILSEAWRKIVAIGHVYGDSLRSLIVQSLGTQEKPKWIEKEEIARISWMLFIMDRGMCFPIGLMPAIDDRRIKIELPMEERDFQNTVAPSSTQPGRFTHDLDSLITMMRDKSLRGSATQLQYLILGYALLGRIGEVLDSSEDDDGEGREEQMESLCAQLVRIRLTLPRSATELSMAHYDDFMQVIWLNVVLSACTILLHHRPLRDGESLDDPDTEMATNWPHCVAAARSAISVLRDASRASVEFVSNAHFPSLLFISSRILMVEYFCQSGRQKDVGAAGDAHGATARDPKLREDLEVVAMTFVRMKEESRGLGHKVGKGMYFYLHQGEEAARKAKAGGARRLVGTCDTWINIPDDYELHILS